EREAEGLLAVAPLRRHAGASEQQLKHARAVKRARVAEEALQNAMSESHALRSVMAVVLHTTPGIARLLGDAASKAAQGLATPGLKAEAGVTAAPRSLRIRGVFAEWDETSQRLLRVKKFDDRSRCSKPATSIQVMTSIGLMFSDVYEGDSCAAVFSRVEPWFGRAKFLLGQTADHLLEAFLIDFPMPLGRLSEMKQLMDSCDVAMYLFAADRASANIKMIAY
ncbi:unnamed protein product, partial [Prorocentrum cordatum]